MAVSLVSTGVQFPDNSIQTTAAAAGGSTTGTASGSISNGTAVIVNPDGTFSSVSGSGAVNGTSSYPATYYSGKYFYAGASDPSTGVSVMYVGEGGNSALYAMTVSGTTITWGSPAIILAGGFGVYAGAIVAMGSNKFMLTYYHGNDGYVYVVLAIVTGTTVNLGTPVKVYPASTQYQTTSLAYDASTDKCVVGFRNNTSPYLPYLAVVSVSGTIVSVGSATQVGTEQWPPPVMVYDTNIQKVVAYYPSAPSQQYLNGAVLTVSGTSVSIGTPTSYQLPGGYGPQMYTAVFNSATNTTMIYYTQYQFGPGSTYYFFQTATQTSTTVTFGPQFNWSTNNNNNFNLPYAFPGYCSTGGTVYLVGCASYTYSYYLGYVALNVSSGGTITFGTLVIVDSTYSQGSGFSADRNCTFSWDNVSKKFIRQMVGALGVALPGAIAFNPPYSTANNTNFLGLAAGSYSNGQTATVTVIGGVNTGVSGLTPGQKYYLNQDGTLATSPNNTPTIYAGLATGTTKIIVKG